MKPETEIKIIAIIGIVFLLCWIFTIYIQSKQFEYLVKDHCIDIGGQWDSNFLSNKFGCNFK